MKQKYYSGRTGISQWLYVNEDELNIEYTDLQNDYHLHYDELLDISFEDYCFDRFNNKETK